MFKCAEITRHNNIFYLVLLFFTTVFWLLLIYLSMLGQSNHSLMDKGICGKIFNTINLTLVVNGKKGFNKGIADIAPYSIDQLFIIDQLISNINHSIFIFGSKHANENNFSFTKQRDTYMPIFTNWFNKPHINSTQAKQSSNHTFGCGVNSS